MNREQCYEMWNKAGEEALQKTKDDFGVSITELRAIQAECFAAAIRAATKEEDAKICEEYVGPLANGRHCAVGIRASK